METAGLQSTFSNAAHVLADEAQHPDAFKWLTPLCQNVTG